MKLTLATFPWLAALALFASTSARAAEGGAARVARSDDPYPAADHPRFFAGMAFLSGGSTLHLRDRSYSQPATYRLGFELGYAHPIAGSLGIMGLARVSELDTEFSTSHGETRTAYDIGVGPELRVQTKGRRPNVQWRIALPLGYTNVHIRPGDGPAVRETYSSGHGFQLGAVGGVDISGTHFGAYVNLTYAMHFFSTTHTATSKESPDISASADEDYLDHEVGLSIGILYRP